MFIPSSILPFLILVVLGGCVPAQEPMAVRPRAPDRATPHAKHLFYLHGRIVEEQGPQAVSVDFGPYEYSAIVRQFADSGFVVISEVRSPNTDPDIYADSVAHQVRRPVASRAAPQNITVVGASKGAVIAMLVASRIDAPVRFVLLGNCNDYVRRRYAIRLRGEVLSIYEASDSLGGSCRSLFAQSPALSKSRELRLETGLNMASSSHPDPNGYAR